MSTHEVNSVWAGGMAFDSHIGEHTIRIDNSIKGGGQASGPLPKPLLLSAISGCTGLDVISTLNKMRVNFTDFSIQVSGVLSEEIPKVYTHISVTYTIKVSDADRDKVNRAVDLSLTKYCGVTTMLSKACEISHSIAFIESAAVPIV
jgi:putative redox protein